MTQSSTKGFDRVICDVGRTKVRIAHNQISSVQYDSIKRFRTSDFVYSEYPIADILLNFLAEKNLNPQRTSVVMSVPTHVLDDEVRFYRTMQNWNFSISGTSRKLALGALKVINDTVALGYAVPLIKQLGEFRLIGRGRSQGGAPILAVGLRSGVGALGMVFSSKEGENGIWLPIQSEGGHIEIAPANSSEAELLSQVMDDLHRPPTVSDVLSGEGTIRLYRVISKSKGIKPDLNLIPNNLNVRAKSNNVDADVAAMTIELWCKWLGSYLRNLALAFGAHGGIYIAGTVPIDLLGEGEIRNREHFRVRFEEGGPGGSYLSRIPTALVTHPYPFLLGLSRLRIPI